MLKYYYTGYNEVMSKRLVTHGYRSHASFC